MTLVLAEASDGRIDIGVQPTHDARPTTETPAYRMAVYLLAAALRPPYAKPGLPAVGAVELQRLSRGRLIKTVIR